MSVSPWRSFTWPKTIESRRGGDREKERKRFIFKPQLFSMFIHTIKELIRLSSRLKRDGLWSGHYNLFEIRNPSFSDTYQIQNQFWFHRAFLKKKYFFPKILEFISFFSVFVFRDEWPELFYSPKANKPPLNRSDGISFFSLSSRQQNWRNKGKA